MKSRGKKKKETGGFLMADPIELAIRMTTRYNLKAAEILKEEQERLGIVPTQAKQRLIERSSEGTFLYKGMPITKDMETQYMRVFRAIFESATNEEYVPYSPLNRRIELYGEEKLLDHTKVVKRIQNGVKEFFYKTKVPELLPDGRKLIGYKRGKGVIFINPYLG
jgi:hypothetical protein